ncbi:Outer membrane porin F precursor [compost metagenome]
MREVLVNEYGVAAERVDAVGYGESRPVADNATKEGRAINRRVEAKVEASQ